MPILVTLDMLYADWCDLQIRYIEAIKADKPPSEIASLRAATKAAWNKYEDVQDRA